ncbi:MAG: hypothetical protein RMJ39_07835 [Deltaproteobacteria bacterium]|nr:hypothetical protein [Deltaproteobacteria bacterium]
MSFTYEKSFFVFKLKGIVEAKVEKGIKESFYFESKELTSNDWDVFMGKWGGFSFSSPPPLRVLVLDHL